MLAEGRAADRAAGRTLEGPHRSDLDIIFAEKDMPAALSSTGEQKALLIGLILAHAELVAEMSGMTPILLLDEVAAHLDAGRRAALFARLAALGCQTFMTGTDAALFEAICRGRRRCFASPTSVAPLAAGAPLDWIGAFDRETRRRMPSARCSIRCVCASGGSSRSCRRRSPSSSSSA